MTGLAWRSLRARRTAYVATGVSVLLGTAVVLAFLTLFETGLGDGVTATDGDTLVTMAAVIGGWAVVIVLFSVASMLGLTVRRRAEEFSLLRTIGSTRRQVRAMVLRESVTLAVVASLLGVLPGWLLGRGVFALVQRAGMVGAEVEHRIGWLSLTAAPGAMLVASVVAGLLAAREATRGAAQEGLTASRTRRDRMGKWRIAGGVVLLAGGTNCAVLTVTVMADSDDWFAPMSTAGPACVLWSIGLALFSPVLLRATSAVIAVAVRVLPGSGGIPAHLALSHTRRRSHDLAGVLMPVLVFVGIATGTLYLMAIENGTGVVHDVEGDNVVLLNYLVVGMIAAFAAIMVVNGTVAAVADRRREFAQQRLAGVTRAELVRTVTVEASVLVVAALVFGGLASLATVVPYSVVRTDGWLPGSGPGWLLGVTAVAVLVTVGTAVFATRRAVATPAVRPQLV